MKKIFAVLILLIFCVVQAAFAGDVIIISPDGQARYEDVTKKDIPITAEILKTTKKILREITVISGAGIIKKIYVDANGKIKKTEQSKIAKENIEIIDPAKDEQFKTYIKKAPVRLISTRQILRKNGYKQKDDSSKNKKEYVKMELLDGDYAILYKNAEYIAEYHKNGQIMGLVKREDIVHSDNNITSVFYEYRLGYNDDELEGEDDDMGLKHILFLDMQKDKYISQYIYLYDGSLLCRQINNNIYISDEARNLLPDWSKRVSNKMEIVSKKYERKSRKTLKNLFIIATYPTWVVPPVGLMFFSVGNMIGGKGSMKKESI